MSTPDPLDPAAVLAALSTARRGAVYDLGTELSSRIPSGDPATFRPFRLEPLHVPAAATGPDRPPFDYSMEVVSGSLHVGTHIDGLAHIHTGGVMHGGIPSGAAWTAEGWTRNGVETLPPFLLRGVLLDIARRRGVDALDGAAEITADEVAEALAAEAIEIRPGDAVLVRTGKIRQFLAGDDGFHHPQPGVGPAAAELLADLGMRLLGTDTSGTEPHPMPDPSRTTHGALLVERGIPLVEILDLERLAADGVREFLFLCLPLRIRGATGSWVRPVAVA